MPLLFDWKQVFLSDFVFSQKLTLQNCMENIIQWQLHSTHRQSVELGKLRDRASFYFWGQNFESFEQLKGIEPSRKGS